MRPAKLLKYLLYTGMATLLCAPGLAPALHAESTGQCQSGNCVNGTGIFRYANGDEYRGGFRAGLRHGPGVYRFARGDVLKTIFSAGRPLGSGEYRFMDGRVFSGEFAHTATSWRAQGLLRSKSGERTRFCNWRPEERKLRCADGDKIDAVKTTPATANLDPGPARLLVLYTARDCRVIRAGRTLPGESGLPLFVGDRIETGPASAELQAPGGMALQLAPFSVLEIPPQRNEQAGVLYLRKGSININYEGDPASAPFRIRAAGTDFDVKGTSFVIEIDPETNSVAIKVYEGVVNMRPALPALDRVDLINPQTGKSYDPETLLSQESYTEIAKALEQHEVAVQANQKAALDSSVLSAAADLNTRVNAKLKAIVKNPSGQPALASLPDDSVDGLKQAEPATAEDFTPTSQELAAMQLLVLVDEQRFRDALAKADADQSPSSADRESISEAYDRQLDRQAEDLKKQIETERPAESLEDLLRLYRLIEVVHFRDGTRKAGAIMAQAGDILIIHAPDGVFRMAVSSVDSISYHEVIPDSENNSADGKRGLPTDQ